MLTKIDKLSIMGVRSFDNAHPETIQFHTPLTLIVGYNGSGKTTIIECLKYATTGDLPPNSKGGAFIHDPNLCGEKDVLAQVKMKFNGTTGAKMVVTRNLQLTVKKNTRQQKTLECTLMVNKNGERSVLSSRVAELDQIMPQNLGVSKAILDSVIFCHQEESLWPMSEPSALKKKFDEIFEALKYTKAIDNIKTLRKAQNDALKVFKSTEQFTKDIKDKGDKAERRSKALGAELKTLREEITELHNKTKEAEEKWIEATNKGAQYTSVIKDLEHSRKREDWLQRTVQELGHDLKEQRKESDEWLQSELDQYAERMAAHGQQEKQQKQDYEKLTRKIHGINEQLRRKDAEAGRYQEQRLNHEDQIKKRKLMIQKTSRDHKIRGYENDLDDMQINEYMEKISKLSRDQIAVVEKARTDKNREKEKAQDVLTQLDRQQSALNEHKKFAKQQSAANDRKIGSLQSDLNKIQTDEGGKAILEDKIKDLEIRLSKSRDDSKKGSWDSNLQENKSQLRKLVDEIAQLQDDVVQVSKQAEDRAELNIAKKEAADCQRNLQKMRDVYGERLEVILGHGWQPSSLEADFRKVNDQRSRLVREAEREWEGVSHRLKQLDDNLSSARSDRSKGEKKMAICVKKLSDNVEGEPEDYPKTLLAIQKDRDTLKADIDNYDNERSYFTDGIALAHKENKCKLCLRNFQAKEQTDFISRLEKKIAKQTMTQIGEELRVLEDDLRNTKDAGSSYDTWVQLSQEDLPKLIADEKKLGLERENILRENEEHDKIVEDRVEARRVLESLASSVKSISDYARDLTKYSGRVQELTAEQKDIVISRTLDEIQEQIRVLGGKSQDKTNSIKNLTDEKERVHSQINAFELELTKAKGSLTSAHHQLEKKADIFKNIEDLKKSNGECRDQVKRFDAQLDELAPKMETERTKFDDIEQRGSDKERDLRQEATKLSESLHQLKLANQNVDAYSREDGAARLEQCQREIESAQRDKDIAEEEKTRVTRMINKIQKELTNHDANKRTIADNIKYRRSLRELQDVKTEVSQLSAQNAEADQCHWKKESRYWEGQHDKFKTQKTSKLGSSKAKDDELLRLIKEWDVDYKDAAYNFKKAHIEVETTKAAVEDLGRYGGALDKAIMKYHGIKMEEINRIIEELWKKTYQGTDVDTILIRSDDEAAKGNRSYNYRVCMIKQDVEMDMRGRCSAGQKVLASIIIRLALAECFGVNCGLIALDEPTTNLDRDNIRSLATSLHDIIESRRHQSNFQLIVITHDEEFLKFMKCPDFCDHYYRVYRNDKQKSCIAKQSIVDVM
ncbi:MAG: DNA repair protein rad50 [Alectoria sarmentosa]|nr:MAG: DNA repair protein rad50 [Alectoria sarmentosa]